MTDLNKNYEPNSVENKWYKIWEENNYFHGSEESSEKGNYSIVIPPPNVTGKLHLGHVLNNTQQDILIRKKRMEGFNVMWLPGTDHAGIATQNVVEKALLKEENKTRHDLGREKFIEKVWDWKEKHGELIIKQLKTLGTSCDWERLRFTMDDGLSNSVTKAFVELHKKGLVYRGKYIVNWCPRCHTALSDEENIHKDKKGKMWHMSYPLADGSGQLVVATTRPETMLGDTAVAVNPSDERYKSLIGKEIALPLTNRTIKIIADDHVDKNFGTGCVKVTPAHDPNDFAIGQRHKLEQLIVMNEDGTMNNNVPEKYVGLDRFKCRKAVLEDLDSLGLLGKIEEHDHSVGHCERCATVTEPYLSTQWFVKYDKWIKPALEAVDKGELNFHPKKWDKTFSHWLTNIRDWCISRQLWWGHRIPVWYCSCDEAIVSETTPVVCPKCGGTNLRQDEDVLDTWFSSWLWPFSTMGYPEDTKLLKTFYPTNTLVTGADIIFFWVARMVFAGLEFTGKLPFKDVYFNSIVRDEKGRKMSKSLGNSPDPIDVIEKFGADALRYTIVALAPTGQDVLFSEDKCELGRNFANKLWNTARFALMNIENADKLSIESAELCLEDKWILSRFNITVKKVTESIDAFNFNEALDSLYHFTWNEFCDWYIEFIKPRLLENADEKTKFAAQSVLMEIMVGAIKLLHPILPFITEEIYSVLKTRGVAKDDKEHIIVSSWPVSNKSLIDNDIENCMHFVQSVISSIRVLRAEKNIPPAKKGNIFIDCDNKEKRNWLSLMDEQVKTLSRTENLTVAESTEKPKAATSAVTEGVTIFLDLDGLIDKDKEIEKIQCDILRAENFINSINKKLSNEKFVSNAPAQVIDKEKEKLASQEDKIKKLKENLKIFE